MNQNLLPLRQRKLLNYLQHATGYMTGRELADLLSVSSRTVRNDVSQINRLLQDTGVQIESKHSFGYILQAQDEDSLKKLTQTGESFISRSERLRYIAQRLCLSDEPIDLDDLADEMFISKTTLEHDLKEFRKKFVLPEPHIQLHRTRNTIEFEHDERKRRKILCFLIAHNWNYNGRGNSFFEYSFLHEKTVNICMRQINYYLDKYAIHIEDINMVHLDLCAAIASERIKEGKELTDTGENMYLTEPAITCTEEMLDSMEKSLECRFNENERRDICELISCSILPEMEMIREEGIGSFFSSGLIRFVNTFLGRIKEMYGLDFYDDEDLYDTLAIFLDYLMRPVHNLNSAELSTQHMNLGYAVGLELAMSIQPLALDFYGNYLDSTELFYLSSMFRSAVTRLPLPKIRTVILSHYNHSLTWSVKALLLERFPRDIAVTDLLSMYQKDNYDFSDTDLILCTANKPVTSDTGAMQIRISPYLNSDDVGRIQAFISRARMRCLYQGDFPDTVTLLDEADWYEGLNFVSYFDFLEFLGKKLIESGCADEKFLADIFRREKILSYTVHSSFILVYSSVCAAQTHLVIGTLEHRINMDGNKIRTIIMLCTKPADRGLIFKLYNDLYFSDFDPRDTRFFKYKKEYLDFFAEHLDEDTD